MEIYSVWYYLTVRRNSQIELQLDLYNMLKLLSF